MSATEQHASAVLALEAAQRRANAAQEAIAKAKREYEGSGLYSQVEVAETAARKTTLDLEIAQRRELAARTAKDAEWRATLSAELESARESARVETFAKAIAPSLKRLLEIDKELGHIRQHIDMAVSKQNAAASKTLRAIAALGEAVGPMDGQKLTPTDAVKMIGATLATRGAGQHGELMTAQPKPAWNSPALAAWERAVSVLGD